MFYAEVFQRARGLPGDGPVRRSGGNNGDPSLAACGQRVAEGRAGKGMVVIARSRTASGMPEKTLSESRVNSMGRPEPLPNCSSSSRTASTGLPSQKTASGRPMRAARA